MTVEEYLKYLNFSNTKMKVLGEMKNFRYYIDVPEDPEAEVGIPLVIKETKNRNTFEICDEPTTFAVIKLFTGE